MSTSDEIKTQYSIAATEAMMDIESQLDTIKFLMRNAKPCSEDLAKIKLAAYGIQTATIPIIVYTVIEGLETK